MASEMEKEEAKDGGNKGLQFHEGRNQACVPGPSTGQAHKGSQQMFAE